MIEDGYRTKTVVLRVEFRNFLTSTRLRQIFRIPQIYTYGITISTPLMMNAGVNIVNILFANYIIYHFSFPYKPLIVLLWQKRHLILVLVPLLMNHFCSALKVTCWSIVRKALLRTTLMILSVYLIAYFRLEINECDSSPCHYSSPCTDHVAYYTCTCVPGSTGYSCEISKSLKQATIESNSKLIHMINNIFSAKMSTLL